MAKQNYFGYVDTIDAVSKISLVENNSDNTEGYLSEILDLWITTHRNNILLPVIAKETEDGIEVNLHSKCFTYLIQPHHSRTKEAVVQLINITQPSDISLVETLICNVFYDVTLDTQEIKNGNG